jgi:hypothetical protein
MLVTETKNGKLIPVQAWSPTEYGVSNNVWSWTPDNKEAFAH